MNRSRDVDGDIGERWFWAIVVVIVVIAVVFRLPGLGSRSLWIDELYTEWFAARSFHALWTDVPTYETHPPFYYSLLKLWTMVFGNSELGLRSLSAVFSLATVFVVAISGRVLDAGRHGKVAGLLGAALLAFNYASIREAQNARPYALQGLVCTTAIIAALILLTRLLSPAVEKVTLWRWLPPAAALGLSAGIGLWIHNTGFFVALGLWTGLAMSLLFAPADLRPRNFAIFFAAGLLALAIWSPYLTIFLEQSSRFMGLAFWLTPKARDLYSAWLLIVGDSWIAAVLPAIMLLFGAYRLFRCDPARALVVASLLLVPLYAALAVSFGLKPVYIQRLFAWMVPVGLLVIAVGVMAMPWKAIRIVLGLAVLALALYRTIPDYDRPRDDWKLIAAEIAAKARPGDVVITVPAEGSIAVGYYARRHPDFPDMVCVPGCYPQRGLPRTYISNFGAPVIMPEDADIVDRALARYRRVWLVQVSISLYDPKGLVRSRIAASRKFVGYTGNSLAKVELFE